MVEGLCSEIAFLEVESRIFLPRHILNLEFGSPGRLSIRSLNPTFPCVFNPMENKQQ